MKLQRAVRVTTRSPGKSRLIAKPTKQNIKNQTYQLHNYKTKTTPCATPRAQKYFYCFKSIFTHSFPMNIVKSYAYKRNR